MGAPGVFYGKPRALRAALSAASIGWKGPKVCCTLENIGGFEGSSVAAPRLLRGMVKSYDALAGLRNQFGIPSGPTPVQSLT